MKKFLLILLLFPITLMSQQGFTRLEVTVKPGHQSSVVNLVDNFFSEAKWKENSGMNLERHWQGSERSHSILWYGPINNSGREDGDMQPYENNAFWSNLRTHLEGTGTAYSGRVLAWKQGSDDQDNVHIYDIIAEDPSSFLNAHNKIVNQLSDSVFKNRTVGFGTYDIGRPGGATHWIGISGTGGGDILKMIDDIQNNHSKELNQYFQERGKVTDIRDFRISNVRTY